MDRNIQSPYRDYLTGLHGLYSVGLFDVQELLPLCGTLVGLES